MVRCKKEGEELRTASKLKQSVYYVLSQVKRQQQCCSWHLLLLEAKILPNYFDSDHHTIMICLCNANLMCACLVWTQHHGYRLLHSYQKVQFYSPDGRQSQQMTKQVCARKNKATHLTWTCSSRQKPATRTWSWCFQRNTPSLSSLCCSVCAARPSCPVPSGSFQKKRMEARVSEGRSVCYNYGLRL